MSKLLLIAFEGSEAMQGAGFAQGLGLPFDILVLSGSADAVTELASYDPINAMRRLGMKPDDFSGDVSGHVTA